MVSQAPTTKSIRRLSPTAVTLVICTLYILSILIAANGNPMAFVLPGTHFTQGDPAGTEGYDGQFAWQIAKNPAGAAPYIDVPAYRYQRILYPLLARLVAFGQPALIPWTMLLINLAAIGVGTWATEKLLRHLGVNRWYALVYGLYGGQLLALRTDLTEPLAQALAMLAMLAWAKDKRRLAVLAFALAALTKETMLVFGAAYGLYALWQKEWRWVFGLGLAAVPFAAYQLFLYLWLGSFGVGSGGQGATPFIPVPLAGWLSIAWVSVPAFLLISLVVGPLSILPALIGVRLSARSLAAKHIHPLTLSLLLNSLVILFLPASTFREPAGMARLTQGLVAAMLLFGGLTRSKRVLNYSFLWLFSIILLIKGVSVGG